VEAVKNGVTRITAVYSIDPKGSLGYFESYVTAYQKIFMSCLPGLRDMTSQIPEYHIMNLIERIVKGIGDKEEARIMSAIPETEEETKEEPKEEGEEVTESLQEDEKSQETSSTLSEGEPEAISVELPPYITNTIPHCSECSTMVRNKNLILSKDTLLGRSRWFYMECAQCKLSDQS
jgi:hypothetical protein